VVIKLRTISFKQLYGLVILYHFSRRATDHQAEVPSARSSGVRQSTVPSFAPDKLQK
jgi:hypothetical protein